MSIRYYITSYICTNCGKKAKTANPLIPGGPMLCPGCNIVICTHCAINQFCASCSRLFTEKENKTYRFLKRSLFLSTILLFLTFHPFITMKIVDYFFTNVAEDELIFLEIGFWLGGFLGSLILIIVFGLTLRIWNSKQAKRIQTRLFASNQYNNNKITTYVQNLISTQNKSSKSNLNNYAREKIHTPSIKTTNMEPKRNLLNPDSQTTRSNYSKSPVITPFSQENVTIHPKSPKNESIFVDRKNISKDNFELSTTALKPNNLNSDSQTIQVNISKLQSLNKQDHKNNFSYNPNFFSNEPINNNSDIIVCKNCGGNIHLKSKICNICGVELINQ